MDSKTLQIHIPLIILLRLRSILLLNLSKSSNKKIKIKGIYNIKFGYFLASGFYRLDVDVSINSNLSTMSIGAIRDHSGEIFVVTAIVDQTDTILIGEYTLMLKLILLIPLIVQ